MDNELTFVLNTTDLKEAGFEGSFNEFADELADMDCIVSGTYDETGAPVITIVGISPEDLAEKLGEYGVEDVERFAAPIEPSSVEGADLDTDADGEGDGNDPAEDVDPTLDANGEEVDDENIPDDEDEDGEDPEEDEEVEIIEDGEDEDLDIDEIKDLHSREEDLHDQEEDIHDQEEEIDPDEEEIELHDEEEEIHDQEEERHDEIEDELEESKKPRGTKNISESLMTSILASVKDLYITKRITNRMEVLESMRKKQEENLNESTKPVTIYLNSWSNNKVNGLEIWRYHNTDIIDLLAEAKNSYKTVYKRYKSLNESNTKRKDYVKVLKKQRALIEMLESEYRFRNLSEDASAEGAQQDLDAQDNQEETAQEATLTSIVFKVKNADEFIKVLTDHGIPAEALKKGSTMEDTDGSDNQADDQQAQDANAAPAPAPDAMGGGGAAAPAPAGGGNPFESLTTPLTKKNKLNEDGNPFDQLAAPDAQGETTLGDPDQPGTTDGVDPLNTDEAADTGDGEEVILTDTSYASQVQKILEDIYGYAKKDFEEKIGGELVDADGSDETSEGGEENPFNDMDGSDDGSDGALGDDDEGDVGQQDTINPADIFGDL